MNRNARDILLQAVEESSVVLCLWNKMAKLYESSEKDKCLEIAKLLIDGDFQAALYWAVRENHVDIFKLLIENGSVNCSRNPFLVWAVENGSTEIVQKLLSYESEYAVHETDKISALHAASSRGFVEIVKLLIETGTDLDNVKSYGSIPLMLACDEGHTEIVQILLDKGLDVNYQDRYKRTALQLAVQAGHADIVQMLIKHGADINTSDGCHGTALMVALKNLDYEIAKILNFKIEMEDSGEVSAFELAVEASTSEKIGLLIANGIDLFTAVAGVTADLGLILGSIDSKIAKTLTFGLNVQNMEELSARYLAERGDCVKIIQMLIQNGADVNTKDICGSSPLMFALVNGYAEVVKLMLENGANIDLVDVFNFKSFQSRLELAKILLNRGCNLNIQNDFKQTGLHLACRDGHTELVNLLVDNGSELDIADCFGKTPLIWAASEGYIEICQILIKNGCDPHTVDNSKRNVLFHSLSYICGRSQTQTLGQAPSCHISDSELPELLLDEGADPNSDESIFEGTRFPCKSDCAHMDLLEKLVLHGLKVDIYPTHTKYPGLLCHLLMDKNFTFHTLILKIVDLLYLSGSCPPTRLSLLLHDVNMAKILNTNPKKLKWLEEKCSDILSLKSISRMTIFRNLKSNKMISVDKLEIPLPLKKFLKFYDLDDKYTHLYLYRKFFLLSGFGDPAILKIFFSLPLSHL